MTDYTPAIDVAVVWEKIRHNPANDGPDMVVDVLLAAGFSVTNYTQARDEQDRDNWLKFLRYDLESLKPKWMFKEKRRAIEGFIEELEKEER